MSYAQTVANIIEENDIALYLSFDKANYLIQMTLFPNQSLTNGI